ncbi:MAG: hypothetical protein WB679_09030 [Terracidiphilus sp.]
MLIGRIDSKSDDLERPVHLGAWNVQCMKPEPMHSVEIIEAPVANPDLRIEIKCLP